MVDSDIEQIKREAVEKQAAYAAYRQRRGVEWFADNPQWLKENLASLQLKDD
jgi:hypothetical protein